MERAEEGEIPVSRSQKFLDPETDYAPVMLRMEALWRQIDEKFLHRYKSKGISQLALEYASLSQRLLYIAETFEKEVNSEKEANDSSSEELHT